MRILVNAIALVLLCMSAVSSAQDNYTSSKTYKANYSQVWKAVVQAMNEGATLFKIKIRSQEQLARTGLS